MAQFELFPPAATDIGVLSIQLPPTHCEPSSELNVPSSHSSMKKKPEVGKHRTQRGHADSSSGSAAPGSCTPSAEGCGNDFKLNGAKRRGGGEGTAAWSPWVRKLKIPKLEAGLSCS